jgi:hypothetical protein
MSKWRGTWLWLWLWLWCDWERTRGASVDGKKKMFGEKWWLFIDQLFHRIINICRLNRCDEIIGNRKCLTSHVIVFCVSTIPPHQVRYVPLDLENGILPRRLAQTFIKSSDSMTITILTTHKHAVRRSLCRHRGADRNREVLFMTRYRRFDHRLEQLTNRKRKYRQI